MIIKNPTRWFDRKLRHNFDIHLQVNVIVKAQKQDAATIVATEKFVKLYIDNFQIITCVIILKQLFASGSVKYYSIIPSLNIRSAFDEWFLNNIRQNRIKV